MTGKYRLISQGLDSIDQSVYSEVIVCCDDDPDKLDALRRRMTGTIWQITGRSWQHCFLIVDENGELWGGEE